MRFKAWMPGQRQLDPARCLAAALGKLSPRALHLLPSAAKRRDGLTGCPHQTTLKPASPNNLPVPSPWVWSSPSGPYVRAGGAESPNCCWGVVCSPGHWTLCARSCAETQEDGAVSESSDVKFPWCRRSPSGPALYLGPDSYACRDAWTLELQWRGARLFPGHPGDPSFLTGDRKRGDFTSNSWLSAHLTAEGITRRRSPLQHDTSPERLAWDLVKPWPPSRMPALSNQCNKMWGEAEPGKGLCSPAWLPVVILWVKTELLVLPSLRPSALGFRGWQVLPWARHAQANEHTGTPGSSAHRSFPPLGNKWGWVFP